MVVYVPLSLLGGEIGKLFQEFRAGAGGGGGDFHLVALSLTPRCACNCWGAARRSNHSCGRRNAPSLALGRGYRAAPGRRAGDAAGGADRRRAAEWRRAATVSRSAPGIVPSEDRGCSSSPSKAEGATLAFTDAGVRKIRVDLCKALCSRATRAWQLVSIVGRGGQQSGVRGGRSHRLEPARGPAANHRQHCAR